MRMLMLGAASLALAASASYADPGKGNGGGGNGGGNGGGRAAEAGPGGGSGGKGQGNSQARGGGSAERAAKAQSDRGNAGPARSAQTDRGPAARAQAPARSDDRGQGAARQANRTEQRGSGQTAREMRGNGNGNGNATARRDSAPSAVREVRRDPRGDDPRIVRTIERFDRDANRGLIAGCPPGLAKKNNGCQPPGLARQDGAYRDAYYRPSWFGYPSLGDGRYYYDDGYLYRTNTSGSILGYVPLLGGALSVGNQWPSFYDPYQVPDYYTDYYNLGSPESYRYADDVFYRVDPQTDAITSIAALLTGDQFAIGQPMPAGYDVYNVPYAYRDQYYDTPEYDYRYADGYVYQVDPTTQLIQAAIQLLT